MALGLRLKNAVVGHGSTGTLIFQYPDSQGFTNPFPFCRGCVSGQQIERMRELCDPNGSGEYDYDGIDGFDEIEYAKRIDKNFNSIC